MVEGVYAGDDQRIQPRPRVAPQNELAARSSFGRLCAKDSCRAPLSPTTSDRTYILDLCCPSARLAVEVDGFAYDNAVQVRHHERREAWLTRQGVRVLRFRAGDVLRDAKLEGVLTEIERAAVLAPSGALRAPPPRGRGRRPPLLIEITNG
jgi:hypothetical protein